MYPFFNRLQPRSKKFIEDSVLTKALDCQTTEIDERTVTIARDNVSPLATVKDRLCDLLVSPIGRCLVQRRRLLEAEACGNDNRIEYSAVSVRRATPEERANTLSTYPNPIDLQRFGLQLKISKPDEEA